VYFYFVLNREKGSFAENIASEYLIKKGYSILFKNWTCRWGELDLVAENNGVLSFIEVKYRYTEKYGEIVESLTYTKKKHLYRTINIFLKLEVALRNCDNWRFGLICITKKQNRFLISYYRNLSLT
jgi:putative endonuclease